MIDTLKSSRLEVRPFSLEDTDLIYSLSGEEALGKWIPDQVYNDKDEAKEVLDFLISQYCSPLNPNEKPLVLAIVLKETEQLIGHIGLSPYGEDSVEIGYAIGEMFFGKGYATEAVSLFCEWAITELGLKRIYGIVAAENIGSYRVLEKATFTKIEELEMSYLGSLRVCRKYVFVRLWISSGKDFRAHFSASPEESTFRFSTRPHVF